MSEETINQVPDEPDKPDILDMSDLDEPEDSASNPDEPEMDTDAWEERLKALESAERAIDDAYSTGKAERSQITRMAQLDAAEAVAMVGIAMEADEVADEAMKLAVITERSGNREKAKIARQKERAARKQANADHKAATRSARQAYDAIRFSAPNRMGFMRVVQLLFAGHILLVLLWLMLTSRDSMSYNVTTMMDWVMVIFEGVAFWTFINRYKIGRPIVIAMAAVGMIVPASVDIMAGQFNPFALSFNGMFYLFLMFYFLFSKRVQATLVNDLGKQSGDYEKDDFIINRKGWPFVRNLNIDFIVFSILGHWMEMGMCQFIIMGFVEGEYDPTNTMLWRDWLYPFPMEGAAVVVIALALYPLFLWLQKKFAGKRRPLAYVISFLAGALLCSLIEFSMGLVVNADLQLWDYTNNFGNIMGQVCLQNTLAFGVVASVITWWVYPLMERWIARVPRAIMDIVAVVIFVFGAIIWSLYLVNPPGVDDANLPENKEHPEAVQEGTERTILGAQLKDVDTELSEFADTVMSTESEGIDKEKLLRDTEDLRGKVSRILKEDVGLESYPSAYERIVTLSNAGQR